MNFCREEATFYLRAFEFEEGGVRGRLAGVWAIGGEVDFGFCRKQKGSLEGLPPERSLSSS